MNGAASKFDNFFSTDRIRNKAQGALYRCLFDNALSSTAVKCGCHGGNTSELALQFRNSMMEVHADATALQSNTRAVSSELSMDVFRHGIFNRYGQSDKTIRLFNYSELSAIAMHHVKRECLDSAMHDMKRT